MRPPSHVHAAADLSLLISQLVGRSLHVLDAESRNALGHIDAILGHQLRPLWYASPHQAVNSMHGGPMHGGTIAPQAVASGGISTRLILVDVEEAPLLKLRATLLLRRGQGQAS